MFSFLQRIFSKLLGLGEIHRRLDLFEERLVQLEAHQQDYRAIQFYIDEAERMYQEDLVKLQEDIQQAILETVQPFGEA
jgi:hypothetical protein